MFERLAAAGYSAVESAGLYGLTPAEFASRLDASGLALCSAHVGLDTRRESWRDEFAASLDEHRAAGATIAVIPALMPDQFADAGAVGRAVDIVNSASTIATARDMVLGYHNHFWEFADVAGRPALLAFFEGCDPAVIAEVDIYWATVGGADAAEVVRGLGARCGLLHVKDGPADDPASDMVAVGSGVIPIEAILAANDDVAWHIVELDRCATDMVEAVEASADYLLGHGWSRGRA
jgi:sugar phosphate isomerase/epimerase